MTLSLTDVKQYTNQDLYSVLCLTPDAPPDLIPKAYTELMQRLNRRRPQDQAQFEQRLRLLNKAKEILGDSDARKFYDRERAVLAAAKKAESQRLEGLEFESAVQHQRELREARNRADTFQEEADNLEVELEDREAELEQAHHQLASAGTWMKLLVAALIVCILAAAALVVAGIQLEAISPDRLAKFARLPEPVSTEAPPAIITGPQPTVAPVAPGSPVPTALPGASAFWTVQISAYNDDATGEAKARNLVADLRAHGWQAEIELFRIASRMRNGTCFWSRAVASRVVRKPTTAWTTSARSALPPTTPRSSGVRSRPNSVLRRPATRARLVEDRVVQIKLGVRIAAIAGIH